MAALALHATCLVWLTWPLARHLGTHVACPNVGCDFDLRIAYWAQAWQVLAVAPATLLDAPVFHPSPHALLFMVLGLGSLPLFAPVYLVTENPTLAGNVAWLGGVSLTAAALHVAVRAWSGLESAGAVAGLTFLTTRWVYWDWIPVAPTYAALAWVPAIIWLLARPLLDTGAAALLGVLLALQSTTDLVYCALPVLVPPALVASWRLARRETRATGLRTCGALALAVLLLAPLVVGYLDVRAANPNLMRQSPWSPAVHGTTLPRDLVIFSPTSIAPAAVALLVLGVVAAAAVGPVAPRAWRQALLWIVVGIGLSLGPTLVVGGAPIPNHLERLARSAFPVLAAIRRPNRLRVTALLGLCLLVGLAFATCVRALRRWPAAARAAPLLATAVAAALYQSARVGWPMTQVPALQSRRSGPIPPDEGYPLSATIGRDDALAVALRRGRGPVLEVPAPAGPWTVAAHARAIYTGLWHWRPLLNGYASYWPAGFKERMAIAERLPDPAAVRQLRRQTGLATIVVHVDELSPARRAAWEAALSGSRADFVDTEWVGRSVVVINLDPAGLGSPPAAPASASPPGAERAPTRSGR